MLLRAQAKKEKMKKRFIKKDKEKDENEENHQANMMDSDDEGEISKGMVGMLFKNRYLVLKYLGSGGFSRIWLVYDVIEKRYAAMKVQFPEDYKEAVQEAAVMEDLKGNKYCMSLYETFDQFFEGKKFFCFILELLGPDLYKLTEKKTPIPLHAIKQITFEMLKGLDFIHSKGYIHTDLKPENILMVNYSPKIQRIVDWFESLRPAELYSMIKTTLTPPEEEMNQLSKEKRKKVKSQIRIRTAKKFQSAMFGPIIEEISKYWDDSDSDSSDDDSDSDDSDSDDSDDNDVKENEAPIQAISKDGQFIKIGDFGLAEKISENPEDIQTLQFRAPEVILVFDTVNEKADIWSLGCIIYELFHHKTLFRLEEDKEKDQDFQHLYLMQKYIGKLPVDFIDEGHVSDEYFTNTKKPKFKSKKYREKMENEPQRLLQTHFEEKNLPQFHNNEEEFKLFFNFLMKCFIYWPKHRPSARELLQDDWFNTIKTLKARQI